MELASQLLQYFLRSDIVQSIFEVVIAIVMVLVSILLIPISLVIEAFFPGFNASLADIHSMLGFALTYTGWIISAFAIPPILIVLVSGYYTFLVMSKITVWTFKLGWHWYKTIKP